jgi:hypothetical protein
MTEPIVHIDYGQCHRLDMGTWCESDNPVSRMLMTESPIDCSMYPQARCMVIRERSNRNPYMPDAIDNPTTIKVFDEGKLVKEVLMPWRKFRMTIIKRAP